MYIINTIKLIIPEILNDFNSRLGFNYKSIEEIPEPTNEIVYTILIINNIIGFLYKYTIFRQNIIFTYYKLCWYTDNNCLHCINNIDSFATFGDALINNKSNYNFSYIAVNSKNHIFISNMKDRIYFANGEPVTCELCQRKSVKSARK